MAELEALEGQRNAAQNALSLAVSTFRSVMATNPDADTRAAATGVLNETLRVEGEALQSAEDALLAARQRARLRFLMPDLFVP